MFLRAFKPAQGPNIPAPRPTTVTDASHGPVQGQEDRDQVPPSEEYPGIPHEDHSELAPDMARAGPGELAPPSPPQ